MAAQEEPWAILAAIPDVVVEHKDAERVIPPGSDISVARNKLPRASILTVPSHISLPACLGIYPYVAAADGRSGLLLLRGTHPVASTSPMASYHICDARTGEAVSLPNPLPPLLFAGANVGLITKGDGDGGCIMVAGLRPSECAGGTTTLVSYMVGDCCKWREREVTTCSPPPPRDWYNEGVVSHGGMLWWVDLSLGLLACDPFADEPPHLFHVPLPQVLDGDLPAYDYDRVNRSARRCVRVSGGRLRYVQIHGGDGHAPPAVSMWVLFESTWCPGRKWEWIPELSVPLAEVWIDESYVNTGLPPSIPALALLHPTNSDRVFFFLRSCIFEVDLQLRKVVGFSEFEMDLPRGFALKRTSHLVHAWHFDPSRSSTRPDFVSTCLRKEKEIAAMTSFPAGTMVTSCRTAKRLKIVWDLVMRQQQEQEEEWQRKLQEWRLQEQKRRQQDRCEISEESRIRQSAFLI